MNTPAAKRRRVDAANATLRKPFHSPLLRRQPPDAGEGGSSKTPGGPNKTPKPNTAGKRPLEEAYSPSSPSAAKQPQPSRPPRGDLRHGTQTSPLKLSAGPGLPRAAAAAAAAAKRKSSGGAAVDRDNPFLALTARAQRAVKGRDAIVRELDRRLDVVRQAEEIEAASERARPGQPVDQELSELVGKWRGAGRVAAEELFETVKERVDNAGGSKAWREMRQRQMDFYRGFDEESPSKSKTSDEDFDAEYSQDVKAHLEEGKRCEEAEGKPDEDDEPEFTMGQMLRSLNIDFFLLGYDEKEDKWVH